MDFKDKKLNTSPEVVFSLIDQIYQASLEPNSWQSFMDAWVSAAVGGGGIMVLQDPQCRVETDIMVYSGFDSSDIESYLSHFAYVNPFMESFSTVEEGKTFLTEEFVTPNELIKTEFYNDWTKPMGITGGYGGVVCQSGGRAMIISLIHPTPQPGIGREDGRQLLQLLMPHLRRAAELNRQMSSVTHMADDMEASFDLLNVGILIINADLRIKMMNREAERIIEEDDGLKLFHGKVCSTHQSHHQHLIHRIKQAFGVYEQKHMDSEGPFLIRRPSGKRPYQALITPVSKRQFNLWESDSRVTLIIKDPEHIDLSTVKSHRALYKLTSAETDLVESLLIGLSLSEYADKKGISKETARTHLKRIMAKTGVKKQTELIKLLLTGIEKAV